MCWWRERGQPCKAGIFVVVVMDKQKLRSVVCLSSDAVPDFFFFSFLDINWLVIVMLYRCNRALLEKVDFFVCFVLFLFFLHCPKCIFPISYPNTA